MNRISRRRGNITQGLESTCWSMGPTNGSFYGKQGWAQIKSRFDLIWRHFREALIWFDLIDFSGALIWFDLNFWTKIQIKSNKNRFFAWHFFRPRFILLKELLTKMNVSRKITLRNAVFWNNFFFISQKTT